MEALFKRYFWVVNLAVLLIVAWLSARVINNFVAGEIAAIPVNPKAASAATPAKSGASRGSAGEWADIVSRRNLFNSDPPEPDLGGGEETDAGVSGSPEGELPGEHDECDAAEGGLSLLATMVADPSVYSTAVVNDGGASAERIVREGESVGDHTIERIYRSRMVLARGTRYECVQLGEAQKGSKPRRPQPVSTRKTDTKTSAVKDGVKKVGKDRYEIDREMLNEQLEDLNALSRQARVIPHYKGGVAQGFKLVGVRPGSLYSHIGVRSGDIIKGVNGEEINSPNKALQLYEKLKNSDNIAVDVERRGRKVTLEYDIK